MPAPKGNSFACVSGIPSDAQIVLRLPRALKSRAVRCASSRNRKLSPWLMDAIREKCEREEDGSTH